MLFVVKCEIVLFQTFLCQHGVQYGNIRRNIPGTVDKKAVQQFFELQRSRYQPSVRSLPLCCGCYRRNRLFVKFPVGVQQFGCSWQIIIHHFLQIRCNFRMNPYLIKIRCTSCSILSSLREISSPGCTSLHFPDMTDIRIDLRQSASGIHQTLCVFPVPFL